MNFITIGSNYPPGKIVPVKCIMNDKFLDLAIKNTSYLLIVLFEGTLTFNVSDRLVCATAPCFICFNEKDNPKFISKKKCKCFSIYFHPQFININMSFELIRSRSYEDIASVHDMFLLQPFVNECIIVPISHSHIENVKISCDGMIFELHEQRDWYWTCRSRSYFIEILIALERMYGLMQANELSIAFSVNDSKLRDAILYVEGHYFLNLTLDDIVLACGVNHTTLTTLFRNQFGITAIEYLMDYRIKVAKKKLSFTFVPIKDIAKQCGFKTVQHFTRVFKKYADETPAHYRDRTFEKRVSELG